MAERFKGIYKAIGVDLGRVSMVTVNSKRGVVIQWCYDNGYSDTPPGEIVLHDDNILADGWRFDLRAINPRLKGIE